MLVQLVEIVLKKKEMLLKFMIKYFFLKISDFNFLSQEHKIREKFINALKANFIDLPFHYSIGGQISFDVTPVGWDKSYCLRFLPEYQEIHFFGDKTWPVLYLFEL